MADLWKPGRGVLCTDEAAVHDGELGLALPAILDDLAVHIRAAEG